MGAGGGCHGIGWLRWKPWDDVVAAEWRLRWGQRAGCAAVASRAVEIRVADGGVQRVYCCWAAEEPGVVAAPEVMATRCFSCGNRTRGRSRERAEHRFPQQFGRQPWRQKGPQQCG